MTPTPRREPQATSTDGRALGDHLKDARRATHLTLRDVEAKTSRAVTNSWTADSYAASGEVHELCSLASRTTFST